MALLKVVFAQSLMIPNMYISFTSSIIFLLQIQWGACGLVLAGNTIVFLTILGYFYIFGQDDFDYSAWWSLYCHFKDCSLCTVNLIAAQCRSFVLNGKSSLSELGHCKHCKLFHDSLMMSMYIQRWCFICIHIRMCIPKIYRRPLASLSTRIKRTIWIGQSKKSVL